jgi:transcriptional regulator GlxA family with amidase domain
MTPHQFVTRERMLQAQQLIRETCRSLIEIALEVGYTSPSHFAQVFRRTVWAWRPRNSGTPSKSKRARLFSARIRQVPHDPESTHSVDSRWSR